MTDQGIFDVLVASGMRIDLGASSPGQFPAVLSGYGAPATAEATGTVYFRRDAPNAALMLYVRAVGAWWPIAPVGGGGMISFLTWAAAAAAPGPATQTVAWIEEADAPYLFVPGDVTAVDGVTSIAPTGGTAGRWLIGSDRISIAPTNADQGHSHSRLRRASRGTPMFRRRFVEIGAVRSRIVGRYSSTVRCQSRSRKRSSCPVSTRR